MSAAIIIGAALCWQAPLPFDAHREQLQVRVLELAPLPTSRRPGAWVITTGAGAANLRLVGLGWQVAADELTECAP